MGQLFRHPSGLFTTLHFRFLGQESFGMSVWMGQSRIFLYRKKRHGGEYVEHIAYYSGTHV